jgi:hypothetical protein
MTVFLDVDALPDPAAVNLKLPPQVTGLRGYWEFASATASVARRNLGVIGGGQMPVSGSPTYTTTGVIIGGATGSLQPFIDDSAAYTEYFIARAEAPEIGNSATWPRLLDNIVSGAGRRLNWTVSGGAYRMESWRNASNFPLSGVGNIGLWRVIAHRMTAAGVLTVQDFTAAVAISYTLTPYVPVARAVNLGLVGGQARLLALAPYSVAHTDQQMTQMGAWLAAQAVALGVTPGA